MNKKQPKDILVTIVVGDCFFNKIEKQIRCVYDVEVRSTSDTTYITFNRLPEGDYVTTWVIPTSHIVSIEID